MILSKLCIENGGFVRPLLVPSDSIVGPSLSNPSILVDSSGGVVVNLRNLNYVLYHSEKGRFEHIWGPLCYLHKENDLRLVTDNIMCRLDGSLNISSHSVIDTTFLDVDPIWEFVGLEDGRLVEWGGKTYLIGVRRDTTPNGQGRMEMSEISFKKNKFVETSRTRIPAPGKDDSYCEKNWMPVLDQEFTFVKWTNPTEVVRYHHSSGMTETIFLSDALELGTGDLRGGSQVIPLGDYRIALMHETNLFSSEAGRKDAIYRHRFVVWDRAWNVVEVSESFSILGGSIEFSCGMAERGDHLLITFGFQDNASYLLGLPKSILGRTLKTYA
jgi:hypothetical protein